jgi:hypothetical protein
MVLFTCNIPQGFLSNDRIGSPCVSRQIVLGHSSNFVLPIRRGGGQMCKLVTLSFVALPRMSYQYEATALTT